MLAKKRAKLIEIGLHQLKLLAAPFDLVREALDVASPGELELLLLLGRQAMTAFNVLDLLPEQRFHPLLELLPASGATKHPPIKIVIRDDDSPMDMRGFWGLIFVVRILCPRVIACLPVFDYHEASHGVLSFELCSFDL